MQRTEAQRDLRILWNGAFLIAIKRVECVVVETGFVGAAKSRRLLVGEGRRAAAIAGARNPEVLRGRAVPDASDVVVRWDLAIDITATGCEVAEEDEG